VAKSSSSKSVKKKSKRKSSKLAASGMLRQRATQVLEYAPKSLRDRLYDYGIAVDDAKTVAWKQVDQIVNDLKSSEFLSNPSVQELVDRVSPMRLKAFTAKSTSQKKAPKKKTTKKIVVEADEKILLKDNLQQMGYDIVKSVLKTVERVKSNLPSSIKKK